MDGEHGLYQKFCMFEPAVKVPLIVSFPGCLPQAKVTAALTEYIGLYPTLAELTGTELKAGTTIIETPQAPERVDAASFADVLRDPESAGPDAVFCEYDLRAKLPRYMIRTKRYKLVYNDGEASNELYDLLDDPGETRNLIGHSDLKTVADELQARLFEWYHPDRNLWKGR
jgi:arylsulfatase A-like enzyme